MGVSWLILTRFAGSESKRNAAQEATLATFYEGMGLRMLVCLSACAKK